MTASEKNMHPFWTGFWSKLGGAFAVVAIGYIIYFLGCNSQESSTPNQVQSQSAQPHVGEKKPGAK